MKKLKFVSMVPGVIVLSFCMAVPAYAAQADSVTTNVEVVPVIIDAVGQSNVYSEPALWPKFVDIEEDESAGSPVCAEYLRKISLQPKSKQLIGYTVGEWEDILQTDEILIDPKFAKSGKIMITWTVRILAYPVRSQMFITDDTSGWAPGVILPNVLQMRVDGDPALAAIRNRLRSYATFQFPPCDPVTATVRNSNQVFPGGEYGKVYTRLVDATACSMGQTGCEGRVLSREIVMALPDGGAAMMIYDPTHTGSVMLTPDMFGGRFPDKLRLKVQWKNTTAMLISSDAQRRNIICILTPN